MTMAEARQPTPDVQAILAAWRPLRDLMGVGVVRTAEDYARASAVIGGIIDEIGEDEHHPLAEVLDLIDDQVSAYEARTVDVPDAPPHEVLRFLMESQRLRQEDLSDCAPQSRISDILTGRRTISKGIAKALAQRFGVRADAFL
ncbi:MAG: helix-turn-helix domain-containing protein [Bosea sp. (in: a-proteobacteria)]